MPGLFGISHKMNRRALPFLIPKTGDSRICIFGIAYFLVLLFQALINALHVGRVRVPNLVNLRRVFTVQRLDFLALLEVQH